MDRSPRDDYYALMWMFLEPLFGSRNPEKARRAIERFRELACNGGMCMASFVNAASYMRSLERFGLPPQQPVPPETGTWPFLENAFPFYVANICRPLYWKWDQAKPVFRRQYQSFARERDRKVFTRADCVNNPQVREAMLRRVGDVMEGLKAARPLSLLYDLRDEPSITSCSLACDTCFCEHCMARMRRWLKDRYGDLAALNAEWDTSFESWEKVEPLTTLEAVERRLAGRWNFAPWADHRDFMSESFVRACAEAAAEVHRHDAEGLAGLAGTQGPAVFNGYDFARLVPVLDWAEPYDLGNAVDLFRSFKTQRRFPMLKTCGLGGGPAVNELLLWAYTFQAGGHGGAIVWASNTALDVKSEDLAPTAGARQLGASLAELRSGIPRLLQLTEEVSSPVAVHYSQASINADFITAVPNRWQAVADSEEERYAAHQCRLAWWRLLEDRGLRPVFVSSGQIEAGKLIRRGVKLLILPRSMAISDAEARDMKRFVEAGGVLLADSFPGRMDEHCRDRQTGALDDLFGIRHTGHDGYAVVNQRASLDYGAPAGKRPAWGAGPLRAECELIEEDIEPLDGATVLGCSEMSDSPIGILSSRGRGKALLLNAAPLEYLRVRARASGAEGLQKFFGGALELAGIRPELEVRAAGKPGLSPGWRVFPFRHGAARYYGLAPDRGVTQDTLGAIEASEESGAGRTMEITFPEAGHVYEARSGQYLGEGPAVRIKLEPLMAPLFAVLPYRIEALGLEFDGRVARARLKPGGKGRAGEHVFRFDLRKASGELMLDSGANVVAAGGAAEWRPEAGLPKGGRLVCRDVATGVSAEQARL